MEAAQFQRLFSIAESEISYCFSLPAIVKIEESGLFRHSHSHSIQMSINQRQHIRFSLDLPVTLITKFGEKHETVLQQISIGGCFTDWEENIFTGDEFRMEIPLPNKNCLPLACKAIYRFDNTGIGVRFIDISEFEQELISKLIAHRLNEEGLPLPIDPFGQPPRFVENDPSPKITDSRREREEMLEQVMSSDE